MVPQMRFAELPLQGQTNWVGTSGSLWPVTPYLAFLYQLRSLPAPFHESQNGNFSQPDVTISRNLPGHVLPQHGFLLCSTVQCHAKSTLHTSLFAYLAPNPTAHPVYQLARGGREGGVFV